MAYKSKRALVPLLVITVLAFLGGLVVKKVKTRRAAASRSAVLPLDDQAKEEWIEEVVATPRPPASELH